MQCSSKPTRLPLLAIPRHLCEEPKWAGRPTRFVLAAFALFLLMAGLGVRLTAAPEPPDTLVGDYSKLDDESRNGVWETLFSAIKKGSVNLVRAFLDHGLDVNVDLVNDCTLLYLAVSDKQPEIVRFLIARGADVNKKTRYGDMPISRACWNGNQEVARMLIAAGAKPDPLRYAVGMGDMAALEALDHAKPNWRGLRQEPLKAPWAVYQITHKNLRPRHWADEEPGDDNRGVGC